MLSSPPRQKLLDIRNELNRLRTPAPSPLPGVAGRRDVERSISGTNDEVTLEKGFPPFNCCAGGS
jgi:hypothetical protein